MEQIDLKAAAPSFTRRQPQVLGREARSPTFCALCPGPPEKGRRSRSDHDQPFAEDSKEESAPGYGLQVDVPISRCR